MGLFSRLRTAIRGAADAPPAPAASAYDASRLVAQGHALVQTGRTDDALACYERAIASDGDCVEAHFALGNLQRDRRRLADAAAAYRRAAECRPELFAPHFNLGGVLRSLGDVDGAVASYRVAVALAPDFVDGHVELGHAELDAGHPSEAAASYRRALALAPQRADVLTSIGNAEAALGHLTQAADACSHALALAPDSADAHSGLGIALYRLGRLPQAISQFRHALALAPEHSDAWTGLLFTLSHDPTVGPDALYAEHLRYGRQFAMAVPAHRNDRDPERRLAVGFVSGDLRNHAVASFLEPVLVHLAGRPSMALLAYSNLPTGDAVTERLRGSFERWADVHALTDDALADRIRADGVDILIDLSGHTSGNRLPVFARKPAPVEVSWLGYLGTTGLAAVDYFLADRLLLPDAQFTAQFSEALVALPAFAAFFPPEDAPPVGPLPALRNGALTFGSFHRASKLQPAVVALWSRVLRALPDTRILLGGIAEEATAEIADRFAHEGIARDRLTFRRRSDAATYLAWHADVDVCLDAFPYTGGATTTSALWMGVPTLTLAGATPPWRQGAALLAHVGLSDFVAVDPEDFVSKAVALNARPDALSLVRAGLRERCGQSTLQRPDLIAAALERALRRMWRRWCAGLPPEAFAADTAT